MPRLHPSPVGALRRASLAAASVAALLIGSSASSELEMEPPALELTKPWSLGEAETGAVWLDADGASRIAWDAARPIGLELRQELSTSLLPGLSLHVGAEAVPEQARKGDSRGFGTDGAGEWQVGSGLRARLGDHASIGIGASWRSAEGDWLSSTSARSRGGGDGEGVVWLRISAEF